MAKMLIRLIAYITMGMLVVLFAPVMLLWYIQKTGRVDLPDRIVYTAGIGLTLCWIALIAYLIYTAALPSIGHVRLA